MNTAFVQFGAKVSVRFAFYVEKVFIVVVSLVISDVSQSVCGRGACPHMPGQ